MFRAAKTTHSYYVVLLCTSASQNGVLRTESLIRPSPHRRHYICAPYSIDTRCAGRKAPGSYHARCRSALLVDEKPNNNGNANCKEKEERKKTFVPRMLGRSKIDSGALLAEYKSVVQ